MGQMPDGTLCLLCELWQDIDDESDLELCCKNAGARLLGHPHDDGQVMSDDD